MASLLAKLPTPFRESRNFIIVCAAIFVALLTVKLSVPKPVKQERAIEKKRVEGKVISPEAYVPVWLYKGLEWNLLLTGAVLLASPWLGRRRRDGVGLLPKPEVSPLNWWKAAAVVGIIGYAAWQNAPRLTLSMWGDEEFNASRFILDEVERQPDGTLKITPRSWVTTLWNMRKPTNHLGYSTFARLSHDTFFHKGTGPDDPVFSEALLRAPVFIAGLLLIPAFFWALRAWGLSPWFALVLLVLHPWYLRFGVDGRAYGFLMLAAALMMGASARALQTGKWAWWVALGLLGFFALWSNLQGLYVLTGGHLVIALSLLRKDLSWDARWILGRRWVVSGLITVVLVLGYLTPCWPQFLEFSAKREISGVMDQRFWQDGLCAYFFGMPWHAWGVPENPLRYSLENSMSTLPWVHGIGIIFFGALFLLGLGWLIMRRDQRSLLGLVLGAPVLMLLHMWITDNKPYDWYFCPFIPGLAVILASALRWPLLTRRPVLAAVFCCMVASFYFFMSRQPRSLFREHPTEACRESVQLYRKMMNPRNKDLERNVISGSLAMYTEGYDPALYRPKDATALRELMAKADQEGKALYINVGYINFLRGSEGTKEACAILENAQNFEHIQTLWGLLPYTTREVFRYRGGEK